MLCAIVVAMTGAENGQTTTRVGAARGRHRPRAAVNRVQGRVEVEAGRSHDPGVLHAVGEIGLDIVMGIGGRCAQGRQGLRRGRRQGAVAGGAVAFGVLDNFRRLAFHDGNARVGCS